MTKFSIITVCYNAEDEIEKTILSVREQTCKDYEHLIIDGGSTDRTLEIVEKYRDGFSKAISEPDSGIYDAMNKGIDEAEGQYLWFLNAGDTIYSTQTLEAIAALAEADVYYGAMQLVDDSQKKIKHVPAPDSLSWHDFYRGMVVSHQSIIVSRKCAPHYDLKYRYVSDLDWIIKSLKSASSIVNTDRTLSNYLLDGYSQQNFTGCWKERLKIVKHHYPAHLALLNHLFFQQAAMRKLIKMVLVKLKIIRSDFVIKEKSKG